MPSHPTSCTPFVSSNSIRVCSQCSPRQAAARLLAHSKGVWPTREPVVLWVQQPQCTLSLPHTLLCPWGDLLNSQPPCPDWAVGAEQQPHLSQHHPRDAPDLNVPWDAPTLEPFCSAGELGGPAGALPSCLSPAAPLESLASPLMSRAVTYRPPAPPSGAAAGLPSDCGRCSGRSRHVFGPVR